MKWGLAIGEFQWSIVINGMIGTSRNGCEMLVKCISEKKRQKSNFLLYLAMYKMEFKWSIGTPGPLERLVPEEMKVMSISSIGEIHFVMYS